MKRIIPFAFFLIAYAIADDCYDPQKVWLVVRIQDKGKVFETNDQWRKDGSSLADLTNKDARWFARNEDGMLTDDVLLDSTGQTELAQKLALERLSDKKRSTIQLIIGLPLGLAMIGGGAYWGTKVWEKETPSTYEMAGSVIIGTAGLGIVIGVISSYIGNHKAPDPNEHTISLKQAADIADRYNTALHRKCYSGSNAPIPSGR